jgi:hypothetical protein
MSTLYVRGHGYDPTHVTPSHQGDRRIIVRTQKASLHRIDRGGTLVRPERFVGALCGQVEVVGEVGPFVVFAEDFTQIQGVLVLEEQFVVG